MEDMAAEIESSVEEGVAGLMEGLEDMGVTSKTEGDESEEPTEESTEESTGEE
jgi:hypothetical protein